MSVCSHVISSFSTITFVIKSMLTEQMKKGTVTAAADLNVRMSSSVFPNDNKFDNRIIKCMLEFGEIKTNSEDKPSEN